MVMRGLLADQLRGAMHDKMIDMISFRRPYLAEQMRQRQAAATPIPTAPPPVAPPPQRKWVYDKNLGRLVLVQQGE